MMSRSTRRMVFQTMLTANVPLTIEHLSIHRQHSIRFVLHAYYLSYLKIINSSLKIIDESRWEDLISSTLPALDQFQFHTILPHAILDGRKAMVGHLQ